MYRVAGGRDSTDNGLEMSKPQNQLDDSLKTNLTLVESFWNRHSFHDSVIDSVGRLNGRVIFKLDNYILVLMNATKYMAHVDEFPTVWLDHRATTNNGMATLAIEVEHGEITTTFRNLRLFRRDDMTIVVPPLD